MNLERQPDEKDLIREFSDIPVPMTEAFYNHVQNWDIVVVWDKDHTMVTPEDNTLRPNLSEAILAMKKRHPDWHHVILTENTMESVVEMFMMAPEVLSVFEMVLCADNFFSYKAIRRYRRSHGLWWPWGLEIRKESIRRKRRRVNDIFLRKKVVLVDDLRDGRVPEHTYVVRCKVWTGEVGHVDEINWPFTIENSIIRILKNLYHHEEPSYKEGDTVEEDI